jgi:hypothetical protein
MLAAGTQEGSTPFIAGRTTEALRRITGRQVGCLPAFDSRLPIRAIQRVVEERDYGTERQRPNTD